ncbi:hypothetical protein GWI33_000587, partial [Rhynchophorus ferrugineus]
MRQNLCENDNLSGQDSSDSCSDAEMNDNDHEPLSVFVTPDHEVFSAISPPSSPNDLKSATKPSTATTTTANPQMPLLSPLLYQTSQGMMYATPSNGGVLVGLTQND